MYVYLFMINRNFPDIYAFEYGISTKKNIVFDLSRAQIILWWHEYENISEIFCEQFLAVELIFFKSISHETRLPLQVVGLNTFVGIFCERHKWYTDTTLFFFSKSLTTVKNMLPELLKVTVLQQDLHKESFYILHSSS